MLLDFAEILRVNVYSLGNTFLKLCRLLNMELPLLDPSLFIGRFASKLSLGDDTRSVANTALRLVSRMKRDWIQTGRRPSGICGAALLIACKMYGHEKTRLEIMRVVRICDATLKKRLDEFSKTDTAALSLEDFKSGVWLDAEADPPSFTAAKEAAANPCSKKRKKNNSASDNFVLEGLESLIKNNTCTASAFDDDGKDDSEVELSDRDEEDETVVDQTKEEPLLEAKPETFIMDTPGDKIDDEAETFSDLEQDTEIGCSLLAPHEVEIKTKIWTELNADYLDYLKKHPNGKSRPRSSRKKKPIVSVQFPVSSSSVSESAPLAESALDAAKKMIQHRKFSKRINHDVLQMLFEEKKETATVNETETENENENETVTVTENEEIIDSGVVVVEAKPEPEDVDFEQQQSDDNEEYDSEAESLSAIDRYRRQRMTSFDESYDMNDDYD